MVEGVGKMIVWASLQFLVNPVIDELMTLVYIVTNVQQFKHQ